MDVDQEGGCSFGTQSEGEMEIKKGPWTMEEDLKLIDYITIHGEGRWNYLARCSGLKRTGKSCRLRWLNYLCPDVRRGNITLQEQLLILQLHSLWGNRWSKIAQQLPGRTDNEIKNYWRTRVQKLAKQLRCDVNSQQFRDTMRNLWLPRLVERIRASSDYFTARPTSSSDQAQKFITSNDISETAVGPVDPNSKPEISDISWGSLEDQVSPVSILTDCKCNNNIPAGCNVWSNNFQDGPVLGQELVASPSCYPSQGQVFDFQAFEHSGGDSLDNFLNDEDIWVLQQQLYDEI